MRMLGFWHLTKVWIDGDDDDNLYMVYIWYIFAKYT